MATHAHMVLILVQHPGCGPDPGPDLAMTTEPGLDQSCSGHLSKQQNQVLEDFWDCRTLSGSGLNLKEVKTRAGMGLGQGPGHLTQPSRSRLLDNNNDP